MTKIKLILNRFQKGNGSDITSGVDQEECLL